MKKVHISYGNNPFYKSLDLLESTSLGVGNVDEFKRYTREWLETTEFYLKNKYVLNGSRGNGWWAWKPHIILNAFESLAVGDVVLYTDAGLKVIADLSILFELASSGVNGGKLIFKLPAVGVPHHLIKAWTKRDCFVLMNADEPKYWNAHMHNGAISVWMKTEQNIEFLKEWQRYMRDPRIVTDDPNMTGNPNFMEFMDHRHDQSVFSILVVKYGFETFRDPTQWGISEIDKFPNSPYPQLFYHHRNFKQ